MYVPIKNTQLKHTLNTCACKTNHVMCLNEYSYILVHVCIRMMTQQHNYEYFVAPKKKKVCMHFSENTSEKLQIRNTLLQVY